jgi:hypothetical protein
VRISCDLFNATYYIYIPSDDERNGNSFTQASTQVYMAKPAAHLVRQVLLPTYLPTTTTEEKVEKVSFTLIEFQGNIRTLPDRRHVCHVLQVCGSSLLPPIEFNYHLFIQMFN